LFVGDIIDNIIGQCLNTSFNHFRITQHKSTWNCEWLLLFNANFAEWSIHVEV